MLGTVTCCCCCCEHVAEETAGTDSLRWGVLPWSRQCGRGGGGQERNAAAWAEGPGWGCTLAGAGMGVAGTLVASPNGSRNPRAERLGLGHSTARSPQGRVPGWDAEGLPWPCFSAHLPRRRQAALPGALPLSEDASLAVTAPPASLPEPGSPSLAVSWSAVHLFL